MNVLVEAIAGKRFVVQADDDMAKGYGAETAMAWEDQEASIDAASGFNRQPAVINGFSDLIVQVFGAEKGVHARSAGGMAELPFDIPVELEGEVELSSG